MQPSTTNRSVFVTADKLDKSKRRKKPEAVSEKSLLESDLTAALAAARRLLKQDLSEVLNASPSSRSIPASGNLSQLEVQKGLLHLASGMRAQALVHSGDKVPVCLAVKPDYTMSVQVSDETRTYSLTDIDQVASGEQALDLLRGCLSCKPPSRICALKMKDGNCLALLPSELVPELFVRCLLQLREGAEDVEKNGAVPGPVKRASSLPSGGKAPMEEDRALHSKLAQEPLAVEPGMNELQPLARAIQTEPPRTRMATRSWSVATSPRLLQSQWPSSASSRFLSASIDDAAPLPQAAVATQRQPVIAGHSWGVWQGPHTLPAWPVTSQIWHGPVLTLPARSVSPPVARPVSSIPVTKVPTRQPFVTQPVPQWTHTVVHPPCASITGWVTTAQRSLPARPITSQDASLCLDRRPTASNDGQIVRQVLPAAATSTPA